MSRWACKECGAEQEAASKPGKCQCGAYGSFAPSADEGTGAGSIVGFQVPMGIKQHKQKVDELLVKHPDIGEGIALAFFSSLDDQGTEGIGSRLSSGDIDGVADEMRNYAVREVVRKRLGEIVRKKPGGGGYVLYRPNKGKKGRAKAVATFPTKLGAKRAELAQFPPREPGKLARARKALDKMVKSPKKDDKKESFLRPLVAALVRESLFHEERTGSDWDDQLAKLSKQAVASDQKLKSLQRNIERRTAGVLEDALAAISRACGKQAKVKSHGVKQNAEKGKTYLSFSAEVGGASVDPIYVYVENGVPRIELSPQAKAALTKADPKESKLFRADLVQVQERVLDEMEDLAKAVGQRDKYLEKVEAEVDEFVSGLSSLQISVLKTLLAAKYRGGGLR